MTIKPQLSISVLVLWFTVPCMSLTRWNVLVAAFSCQTGALALFWVILRNLSVFRCPHSSPCCELVSSGLFTAVHRAVHCCCSLSCLAELYHRWYSPCNTSSVFPQQDGTVSLLLSKSICLESLRGCNGCHDWALFPHSYQDSIGACAYI